MNRKRPAAEKASIKPHDTASAAHPRRELPVSPRPLEHPTASDAAENADRPEATEVARRLGREHEHTRGRAWDSEDSGFDDTDTDVLPRDRDLVDETEDRE